jgi:hypothetical protein
MKIKISIMIYFTIFCILVGILFTLLNMLSQNNNLHEARKYFSNLTSDKISSIEIVTVEIGRINHVKNNTSFSTLLKVINEFSNWEIKSEGPYARYYIILHMINGDENNLRISFRPNDSLIQFE